MSRERTAFWLIVLLGALLRLATLGRQSLWLDESISFWTANRSFEELAARATSGFRPLYYWFVQPMVVLGGDEWLLRLPSALAGIGSLALLYMIGKELFDQRTGLIAALLLAVSPLHIWYSQEARMYALVSFFVLAALFFALRGLKRNDWLNWILFGVFESLALWTETAAIWFVLSLNLAALLMVGYLYRQKRLWGFVASQALALLLYLPAVTDLFNMIEGPNTRWIPPLTILAFLRGLADFGGGFMRTRWEGALVLVLVAAAGAIGAKTMLKDARTRGAAYFLLVTWLVLPLGISFILSQEYFRPAWLAGLFGDRRSIFLTRNLITVLFPALLLLARSLAISPYRRISLGLLAALALVNLGAYLGNTLTPIKEDYRQAARIVSQGTQPGDLVLTSPGYIEQPLAYYYRDPDPPGLSLESLRDGIVNEADGWHLSAGIEGDDFVALPVMGENARPRVWLVTTTNTFHQPDIDVLEYLEQRSRLVDTWQLSGVTVQLYDFSTVSEGLD